MAESIKNMQNPTAVLHPPFFYAHSNNVIAQATPRINVCESASISVRSNRTSFHGVVALKNAIGGCEVQLATTTFVVAAA